MQKQNNWRLPVFGFRTNHIHIERPRIKGDPWNVHEANWEDEGKFYGNTEFDSYSEAETFFLKRVREMLGNGNVEISKCVRDQVPCEWLENSPPFDGNGCPGCIHEQVDELPDRQDNYTPSKERGEKH